MHGKSTRVLVTNKDQESKMKLTLIFLRTASMFDNIISSFIFMLAGKTKVQ